MDYRARSDDAGWQARLLGSLSLAPLADAHLNPRKTILQPVDRGIDFVGHLIRPWHRTPRANALPNALRRLGACKADEFDQINSYFGLFRQSPASHHLRARLANEARQRGFCVDGEFTKIYRKG